MKAYWEEQRTVPLHQASGPIKAQFTCETFRQGANPVHSSLKVKSCLVNELRLTQSYETYINFREKVVMRKYFLRLKQAS